MPKSNSTELIEELLKTIDRVGLKKTIQRLRDTTNQINEIEVLQEFIIEKTCNVFQISRQTLLTGRENTPNRTKAIGVCSVLLSNHCKIPQRKIASVMRKDTSKLNKVVYNDLLDSGLPTEEERAAKRSGAAPSYYPHYQEAFSTLEADGKKEPYKAADLLAAFKNQKSKTGRPTTVQQIKKQLQKLVRLNLISEAYNQTN